MNFPKKWDDEEREGLGLTIEGFTWGVREYLVISMDENGKVFGLTTELPGAALSLAEKLYIKGGSDRCPQCASPYSNEIFNSLANLPDYEELGVKCVACGTKNIYFRKGLPFDLKKVKEFFDKYLTT